MKTAASINATAQQQGEITMPMREPENFMDRYQKQVQEWERLQASWDRKGSPFSCDVETSKGYIVHLTGEDRGFGDWAKGHATVVSKKEIEECGESGSMPPSGRLFTFTCKHFCEGSEYGIDNGKVSKLSISLGERGDCSFAATCLLNYDRGWDVKMEETKREMDAAYEAILRTFN